MSGTFDELLQNASVDEAMDVDMSYLTTRPNTVATGEPARPGGADPEPDRDIDDDFDSQAVGDRRQSEPGGPDDSSGVDVVAATQTTAAAPAQPDVDAASAPEPEPEPGSPEPQAEPAVVVPETSSSAQQGSERDRAQAVSAVSTQRKTDQQVAVQSASAHKNPAGAGNTAALPRTGFNLSRAKKQLQVRGLPDVLITALQEQVRAATVRDRGIDADEAREFSQRLSQPALVIAALSAQFDVDVDTDASTSTAVELFRSQNPLLGSLAARMEAMEQNQAHSQRQLSHLEDSLKQVKQTSQVTEQLLAYSIADRTENLAKGIYAVSDVRLTHKSSITMRDKARDETRKREKFEQDRDGRPMR
ncbi:hypothetical protein [Arthrobacter castelli]|uniref:hypothetical protein n=1 Tax=Arthrobacter castelli TaxID=271431 RepID=UPI0003FFFC8D|nr:hypothetical protein [Arthrobacter castelli]